MHQDGDEKHNQEEDLEPSSQDPTLLFTLNFVIYSQFSHVSSSVLGLLVRRRPKNVLIFFKDRMNIWGPAGVEIPNGYALGRRDNCVWRAGLCNFSGINTAQVSLKGVLAAWVFSSWHPALNKAISQK